MTAIPSLPASRLTRRSALLAGGMGTLAAFGGARMPLAAAQAATQDGLSAEILQIFASLPGEKGLRLWAPPDAGRPAWEVSSNAAQPFFIASAFKSIVLAEYLRQLEESLDPTDIASLREQLAVQLDEDLTLDESVFSPGSPAMNPPSLLGELTTQTVMEAMIAQSDNTATDMALRRTGPERVRELITSLGLTQTHIPDSTRQFFGYVFGAPDWQDLSWDELLTIAQDDPYPHRPLLNDEITMGSSADDLVAFYSHVFQGGLFRYPETLACYRGFLSLANTIALSMPLGVNAFAKSGWGGARSGGEPSEGVSSMAGAVFVQNRWVYFAQVINWPAEAGTLTEIEPQFFAATNAIFTLVRDRLT